MKLTLTTFITVDGVVQAPGGRDEDREEGFEHGGWVAPHWDDELGETMNRWFARVDAFLLGRRTYEIFAAYWPKVTDPDDPIAGPLNKLPKYVASRTLTEVLWENSRLLEGDVAAEVARLKEQEGGELQVHGSGNLAQTLFQHGLVDELMLITFPVVLGTGKRLFGEGAKPTAFELVDSRTTGKGVSIDVFRAAGEPTYGSVGSEYEA
ncbi:MAG: dihydrofolate reductase family protein [Gaiellaceae bacterium]